MSSLFDIAKGKKNIFINEFNLPINKIDVGLVFLYCSWGPTLHILKYLIDQLSKSTSIYIYDLDNEQFDEFKNKWGLETHGNGETFWIRNGEVIGKVIKHSVETKNEVDRLNNLIR